MLEDQFIGEIIMFGGNYAPQGWMFCNGQLLPIAQYQNLFKVIGKTYGGDGVTNFAVPNLQGAAPLGAGQGEGLTNRPLGSTGGKATVALTEQQLPAHSHLVTCTDAKSNHKNPALKIPAASADGKEAYSHGEPDTKMNAATIGATGMSAPHNNMPPYLALNFIIAFEGIIPERN